MHILFGVTAIITSENQLGQMKIFKEEQRFDQWWIYLLFGVVAIAVLFPIVFNFSARADLEYKIELSIALGVFILVIFFIFSIRLITRIDEHGIHYRFYPLHGKFRSIGWDAMEKCYATRYNPILDYGGWGFRVGFLRKNKGKAYTVKGNIGIKIKLKNGKNLLIGTQKEADVKMVLSTYNHKFVTT